VARSPPVTKREGDGSVPVRHLLNVWEGGGGIHVTISMSQNGVLFLTQEKRERPTFTRGKEKVRAQDAMFNGRRKEKRGGGVPFYRTMVGQPQCGRDIYLRGLGQRGKANMTGGSEERAERTKERQRWVAGNRTPAVLVRQEQKKSRSDLLRHAARRRRTCRRCCRYARGVEEKGEGPVLSAYLVGREGGSRPSHWLGLSKVGGRGKRGERATVLNHIQAKEEHNLVCVLLGDEKGGKKEKNLLLRPRGKKGNVLGEKREYSRARRRQREGE